MAREQLLGERDLRSQAVAVPDEGIVLEGILEAALQQPEARVRVARVEPRRFGEVGIDEQKLPPHLRIAQRRAASRQLLDDVVGGQALHLAVGRDVLV